ncbi:hypothetical protein OAX78_00505 [Planctomycetota bacterium]|nr:hypothetical protein [Planctomycetota bacterium]
METTTPGLTGRALALLPLLGAAGRRLPAAELLGLSGLAFRTVFWLRADNAEDAMGEPLPGPIAWPLEAEPFPGVDVLGAIQAATGVRCALRPEPVVVAVGDLPGMQERSQLRAAAVRAALGHASGGVSVLDGVRYRTGVTALKLAAAFAASPNADDDPDFDWEEAWAGLATLGGELSVARRAAAVFLETWAQDRADADPLDALQELLRTAAKHYRDAAEVAALFPSEMPGTPELLRDDPKQNVYAADCLSGAAAAEVRGLKALKAVVAALDDAGEPEAPKPDAHGLAWSPAARGLGPSAEAGLVAQALAFQGAVFSAPLLRVVSGHAFRFGAAPLVHDAMWPRVYHWEPARDPWQAVAAWTGATLERHEIAPEPLWTLVSEERKQGRALVLCGTPELRPPGLLLGARTHKGAKQVLLAQPTMRPTGPADAFPEPGWVPVNDLSEALAVLKVVAGAGTAARDHGRWAVASEAVAWGEQHARSAVLMNGLGRGQGAYKVLSQTIDKIGTLDEVPKDLVIELDAYLSTAVEDLRSSRGAAAVGVETLAADLERSGFEEAAMLLRPAAEELRGARRAVAEIDLALEPAWRAGLANAELVMNDTKTLADASILVLEAQRAEKRGLKALKKALRAVEKAGREPF